jgi:high-affinity iron transporter
MARLHNPLHPGYKSALTRALIALLVLAAASALMPTPQAAAQGTPDTQSPAQVAEVIRSRMSSAQIYLPEDKMASQQALDEARAAYSGPFAGRIKRDAPAADASVARSFDTANGALRSGNAALLASARAEIWTSLLGGSYVVVQNALASGDIQAAREWVSLREFRHATRFSRPGAGATLAVEKAASGEMSVDDAALAVRADLLDTYQARLDLSLRDLPSLDAQDFAVRRAEAGALATGYFAILAPSYGEQRDASAMREAQDAFGNLRVATLQGTGIETALADVERLLKGFRAAPLSLDEKVRRTGQMNRFLSLVPVEYARGVHDGRVTLDLEVQEAVTFRDGAAEAFADLQSSLDALDPAGTGRAAALFGELAAHLNAAKAGKAVPSPDEVRATTTQLQVLLEEITPAEWKRNDSSADFDVIASVLDRMEVAVAAEQYGQAEAARLEAYAILETGPEARLMGLAPELSIRIESLFWYGQGETNGLGYLISERASLAEIKRGRAALDAQLAEAEKITHGNSEPLAVATNASIIVFREGLEAVLILASLLGSLKVGANRKFRKPLWAGAGMAFVVTVLTYLLARGVLMALAQFGEKLEAIVSLVSIAVLLLITNWFFHKVYWTGWIANFHSQKKRLISGEMGQMLGLVTLGFTSIYREGFETVLFLQALVLEAGAGVVLAGVAIGLLGVVLVGLVVFALQAKLPYKKMLVVTGVMIGGVLLIMVGNTVHVLQVVGWLPLHPIQGITLPYWLGMWLGVYATWEGVLLQFASGTFVIGSYFLAERRRDHRVSTGSRQTAPAAGSGGVERGQAAP